MKIVYVRSYFLRFKTLYDLVKHLNKDIFHPIVLCPEAIVTKIDNGDIA